MAKINCYSQLIAKDLNEAYFLPYTISSYHKDAKFHNDKKYLVFDRRRDMKTVDTLPPIRHLATIGNAVVSLVDIKPDSLQLDHWNKWLSVFAAAEVKSIEEGFADDIPVVSTGPLQCLYQQRSMPLILNCMQNCFAKAQSR